MIASGIREFLDEIGGITLFMKEVFRITLRTKGNFSRILEHAGHIAGISLGTVLFGGIFVGAILVLQFNQMLAQYEAQSFLGGLNTSAVIREVGPLIISFLLAGKVGAFTAAELGTMRVTEQIDAIECLGTHPIQYLILPRFYGIVIATLLLLFIGLSISVLGAIVVAQLVAGVNPLQFISSIPRFTTPSTLIVGVIKCFVYGNIVAAVSCYKGFTTTGGARGVGRAVTQASIYTNFYIVLANYVCSQVIDTVRYLMERS